MVTFDDAAIGVGARPCQFLVAVPAPAEPATRPRGHECVPVVRPCTRASSAPAGLDCGPSLCPCVSPAAERREDGVEKREPVDAEMPANVWRGSGNAPMPTKQSVAPATRHAATAPVAAAHVGRRHMAARGGGEGGYVVSTSSVLLSDACFLRNYRAAEQRETFRAKHAK